MLLEDSSLEDFGPCEGVAADVTAPAACDAGALVHSACIPEDEGDEGCEEEPVLLEDASLEPWGPEQSKCVPTATAAAAAVTAAALAGQMEA